VPLRQTLLALLVVLFGIGSTSQAFAQQTRLPVTQPGLGRDEGVFLITSADDGSRVVFFVAQNARHAILEADLQFETQLNPLWPTRTVTREEALAYPEGAPVGAARTGLLAEAPAEAPVVEAEPAAVTAEVPAEVIAEAPAEVVAEAPADTSIYVLQRGDNLTHIARDHGTTVQAILEANGISNPNRIYAGQPLVIPGSAPAAPVIVAEVPAEAVVPETAADGESMTYTVKRGDSAIGIARELGVDVDELLAANGVSNRNRIYAGQVLTVPATSS
jgi:LysM repeat protein